MDLFIVLAMAGAPDAQGGGGSIWPTFIMFGVIFAIFYFMIIRPQKKRMNDQKALLAAVKRGDKVIASSGIHGTVHEVEEGTVLVEVAKNVVIRMEKGAIQSVSKAE
jgi:preprotein translocase subunit YajC